MIRKITIWLSVIFLAGVVGVYLAKNQVQAPETLSWPSTAKQATITKLDIPSDFSAQIVSQINTRRKTEKLSELAENEKLNKSATSRLAVIMVFDDYTGSVSGLTREKATESVGYQPSIIGDVFFSVSNKADDFLSSLLADKTEKETILLPKFTDLGIAEYKTETKNYYYVLFGNEQKKVSTVTIPKVTPLQNVSWGGPDLWNAVNKRRVELGVGQLSKKDELCTIASIRLNQLLELIKLDGHAGFQPVLDRSDLKWIGEKYNISEYLAQGFETPTETVKGWENTLGHRSLLAGGEYVWGCIYAQNTFAVAITAY